MFVFGHLGMGSKLVSRWAKNGLTLWVGTLLPDLIDKSAYYLLSSLTGLKGSDLPLIHGTRSFGHTGLLILMMWAAFLVRRSNTLKVILLGVLTHFLLDLVSDQLLMRDISHSMPIFWPIIPNEFPLTRYSTMADHFWSIRQPALLIPEIIGFILFIASIFNTRRPGNET